MDVRDDVSAAIKELSGSAETTNEPAQTADVAGDGVVEGGGANVPADAGGVVKADSGETEEGDRGGRVRGPDGKFAKGTPAPKSEAKPDATKAPVAATGTETKTAPATATGTTPPVAAVSTPTLKAPQSWKADVREEFAKLPPTVQAEVLRREAETQQAIQAHAPAKRIFEAVAPYEAAFKAHGSDVVQALPGILQTVQQLATGRMEDKTAILGNMVRAYLGNDQKAIEMLARHIDSGPVQQQAPQQVDPRAIAAQVREELRQEQMQQQNLTAAQEFMATQPEFLNDVNADMQGLIQAALARGEPPSVKLLQDSYDRACWANPNVRAAIQQRSAQGTAKTAQEAAARARNASVSVRPAPVVAPVSEGGNSVADDVRASLAELRARK